MPHPNNITLAYDRASVRTIDQDGRLHVEVSPISKACVNPYRGNEIPSWETLGLNPERVYWLLRDPAELAKGASTFNNIPILNVHIPVHVSAPAKEAVCGSTGTDCEFDGTYLCNSLVIWTAEEIDGINKKTKYELSSAYRYDADMTPGTFAGVKYDGIMRNIRGNHVALVREGRAGPDVVVGDSKLLEKPEMAKKLSANARAVKGALIGFFTSRVAMDAQLKDLTTIAVGVKSLKGAPDQKALVEKITVAMDGKLVEGATLDGLPALLAQIAQDEADEPDDKKAPVAKDADGDDDDEEEKKRKAALDADGDKDKVDKPAMDAAIAKAVTEAEARTVKRMNEMHTAIAEVKPHIGEVAAMDSAASVYALALDAANVDLTGVTRDTATLRAMVGMLGKKSEQSTKPVETLIAQDAAQRSSFDKRFPKAGKVKVSV